MTAKTISSVGEFGLIRKLTSHLKFGKNVLIGTGDDAAVLRLGSRTLLLTTDLLVEGRHFRTDWATARQIGFKAMRVNLSDIAAMGGRPLYALISVGLPKTLSATYAVEMFQGLQKAAEEGGCAIVGGDTNAADGLLLNVAIVGEAPSGRFVTRGGARPGDVLFVTGTLGGSALGLAALQKKRRKGFEQDIRRHKAPPLRLDVGRFLAGKGVSSLIDLSDGLVGDLPHLLERSGVGAVVDWKKIPMPSGFEKRARTLGQDPLRLALGGGEDYELLFTASPNVKIPSKIHGVSVTEIGTITRKQEGRPIPENLKGFRHF